MRRDTAAPVDRAPGRLYSASGEAERLWHRLGDIWEEPRAAPRPQDVAGTSLETVIEEFLREAEEGDQRAVGNRPYTYAELRELRAALIHIASELGTTPISHVTAWEVRTLIDRLGDAGLSAARLNSVMEAFRSLYAYAERRRLVHSTPVPRLSLLTHDEREPARSVEFETPTDAMLALGTRVATWTERLVLLTFIVIAVALGIELGLIDSIPLP
jgi:hypothetical protein